MSLEGFYFIASSPSSWSGSIECNETICWALRGQPYFGEQYNFNNYIFVCCYNSQIQFLERHGYCWPVFLKAFAILLYSIYSIFEKCVVIKKVLFYRTPVRSLSTLVTNSITDWLTHYSCWDLIDVTLACEDSRNLSLPYQLLSVLTAMLSMPEHNKSHVVDD